MNGIRFSAHADGAANLQDAHPHGPKFVYARLYGWLYRAPAEFRSLCPRPRQPGVHSFPDNAALKLGEHAKHLEHSLARGN